MLETLNLQGYRGFDSFRLTDLTRVNLLVGKNNCGKTSILEAVELLVSRRSVAVLRESAIRRGEIDGALRPYNRYEDADISHFFYGHRCMPDVRFELSSEGDQHRLAAKILSLDKVGEAAERWVEKRSRRLDPDEEPVPAFGLRFLLDEQQEITLPIGEKRPRC